MPFEKEWNNMREKWKYELYHELHARINRKVHKEEKKVHSRHHKIIKKFLSYPKVENQLDLNQNQNMVDFSPQFYYKEQFLLSKDS